MKLFGKRSVSERIKTNPQSIRKIYLQEGLLRPEIAESARKNNLRIETLSVRKFTQFAQGFHTQGVMADVEEIQYADYDEIIAIEPKEKKYTLICLDRINDPQNLGVILRNSACFGGFCIVLPKHETVEITEAVLKVACGAENYVPVCKVSNLSVAVQKAQEHGYWVGATVVQAGEHPGKVKLNFPLCLLFGSEGEGIRKGLIKHIDYKFTLPMRAGLSFNVAMAVGIFCYEVICQKNNYEC